MGGDLPGREALSDVFLVEENRVGVGSAEGEVNEIGAVAVEENRFGTVYRGPLNFPQYQKIEASIHGFSGFSAFN
jgi:hypothetical protein